LTLAFVFENAHFIYKFEHNWKKIAILVEIRPLFWVKLLPLKHIPRWTIQSSHAKWIIFVCTASFQLSVH